MGGEHLICNSHGCFPFFRDLPRHVVTLERGQGSMQGIEVFR
ncbi:hypothetical protein JOF37_001616 [Microbacterium imperiale]|nr:hypothetical protein [Microbacterium imperiale]